MQPQTHWPVGSSLRFSAEVATLPGCAHLAKTAVIVLTPPEFLTAPAGRGQGEPEMRQLVYAFAAGGEGWVLPEHLEPIPVTMLAAYRSKRWPVKKS
jgi:hypothetical protein